MSYIHTLLRPRIQQGYRLRRLYRSYLHRPTLHCGHRWPVVGSVQHGSTTPRPSPQGRRWLVPAGLLLSLLPISYFYHKSRGPKLDPYVYSDHVISSTTTLSPDHVLLTIPLSAASRESFSPNAPLPLGSTTSHTPQNPERDPAEITVQHVMIKQPDLQIERPYTPVNDPGLDGEMRLVVKRVRGGEVGRMLHSRHANELVGLRGPLTTFSIIPEAYDRIVMISSGTGVAPFLQLLASLPPQSSDPTRKAGRYHLVHLKPDSEQVDWAATSGLLPRLQEKLSYDLSTYRPEKIQKSSIQKALGSSDRSHILVLVCLPPHLMRPLCGLLGPNLEQGPITGILGELGLDNRHVWKLE